jgi:hypothetical protein
MYSYQEITNELILKAKIPKDDIFYYDFSPLQSIFEHFFQFCQHNLSEYNKEHNIQPARFYYREEYGINAKAGIQNDYYIIGINKETITMLYGLFHDQNDIFEAHPKLHSYLELNRFLNVSLGVLMFQMASLFTFNHELAHLIQKSDKLSQWFSEQYSNEKDDTFSVGHHILEFDADLYAAHLVCFHQIDYWQKQDQQYRTPENLVKMLTIGAASIFSYVMLFRTTGEEMYYKKYFHPHPVVRISYILDCFTKVAKINLPESTFDPMHSLREAFEISEIFFTSIIGQNLVDKFRSIYRNQTNEIKRYVDELIALSKDNLTLAQHKTAFPKKKKPNNS